MPELSERHLTDRLGAQVDKAVTATVETVRWPVSLAGALVLLALDKVSVPRTDLRQAPGSDDPFITHSSDTLEGESIWQ